MIFEQLFDPRSSTYTYLVGGPHDVALVDPVREQIEAYRQLLRERGLTLVAVLETHVHADHVTAAGALREQLGPTTYVPQRAEIGCADRFVKEGDVVRVGDAEIAVLETPGHTPESVSYRIGDRVLTGDALLIGSCGRTDFQGGDPGQLWDSVHAKLFTLPGEVQVFPAHDYRGNHHSTIAAERSGNARLTGRTRAEFIELMNGLDLPPPQQIAEALPANRACGKPA